MYSTQVQSVFMLIILCTLPRYFVYNNSVRLLAITTSTHLPLLLYTVNINLCGIVCSVLHEVIIIISGRGSTPQDQSSRTQTVFLEVTIKDYMCSKGK